MAKAKRKYTTIEDIAAKALEGNVNALKEITAGRKVRVEILPRTGKKGGGGGGRRRRRK